MLSRLKYFTLVIVVFLTSVVLQCLCDRVVGCNTVRAMPEPSLHIQKHRVLFTVWSSISDQIRPKSPENTCLCQTPFVNGAGRVEGFQLAIGPCGDTDGVLCLNENPVWNCNCPFLMSSGKCKCRYVDTDDCTFETFSPIDDIDFRELLPDVTSLCFPLCEEHGLVDGDSCPDEVLGDDEDKCVVSTWTFCVCDFHRDDILGPCTCDTAEEESRLPECYTDPDVTKCALSIPQSPPTTGTTTDAQRTPRTELNSVDSFDGSPGTAVPGNAAEAKLGVPVYAGIGAGVVLLIIIIILVIVLCCVISRSSHQHKDESSPVEGERKLSGAAFSHSFVYKKEENVDDVTQLKQPDNEYTVISSNQSDDNQIKEKPMEPLYDNRKESMPPVYDTSIEHRLPQQQEGASYSTKDQPENVVLANDYIQHDTDDDVTDPVYFQLERADSLKENGNYEEAILGEDNNGGMDNNGYLDVEVNGQYDTLQRTGIPNGRASSQETSMPTVSENAYGQLSQ